jgi:hypothetical protein
MGTLHHLTTASAAQKRAVSTARHQHNRLFSLFRKFRQTIHECPTDQASMAIGELMAHIDDLNRRQRLIRDALLKTSQSQRPFWG